MLLNSYQKHETQLISYFQAAVGLLQVLRSLFFIGQMWIIYSQVPPAEIELFCYNNFQFIMDYIFAVQIKEEILLEKANKKKGKGVTYVLNSDVPFTT